MLVLFFCFFIFCFRFWVGPCVAINPPFWFRLQFYNQAATCLKFFIYVSAVNELVHLHGYDFCFLGVKMKRAHLN